MVIGSKSRKLKFTNIEESNEGAYMCRASNKGGMVTSNPGTVTVYGELAIAKCKLQLASYLTIWTHIGMNSVNFSIFHGFYYVTIYVADS